MPHWPIKPKKDPNLLSPPSLSFSNLSISVKTFPSWLPVPETWHSSFFLHYHPPSSNHLHLYPGLHYSFLSGFLTTFWCPSVCFQLLLEQITTNLNNANLLSYGSVQVSMEPTEIKSRTWFLSGRCMGESISLALPTSTSSPCSLPWLSPKTATLSLWLFFYSHISLWLISSVSIFHF